MAILGGLRNQSAPQTSENVRGPPGRPTDEIWLRRVEGFSFWGAGPQTGSSFILGGYVISTLPKFGHVLADLPVDLLAKRGPLSAVRVALRRGPKKFVIFRFWGLTPKPEVEFEN